MSDEIARCEICGEPMPAGEEMFKYHGYSGLCPAPRKPKRYSYDPACEELARHFLSDLAPSSDQFARDLAQHLQDEIETWLEFEIKKRGGTPPNVIMPEGGK